MIMVFFIFYIPSKTLNLVRIMVLFMDLIFSEK
jgi:hypothetical protein